MTPIDRSKFSCNNDRRIRIKSTISLLGMLFLAGSIETAFAQIDPSRSLLYSGHGQQTVSKNQLLTPSKALKAADRARGDFLRGKFDSAQKEIDIALEIAPEFAIALATQGALDLQAGRIDRAASFFQKAIDKDPSLAAAYVGLAMDLLLQHRFKDALAPLDRADGLVPGSWYIHFETGLIQLGLGNSEAALEQVEIAGRLANGVPKLESGISYLHALISLQAHDPGPARKYLENAIKCDPNGYYGVAAAREMESTGGSALGHFAKSEAAAAMSKINDLQR